MKEVLLARKMKKIWLQITNLGVHEGLNRREARRVSYVNYITVISMLYLEIRCLLNISNPPYFLRLFVLNIPGILVFILNYYKYHTMAKVCLFTVFVTATSIISYTTLGGFKYGTFMLLFAAVPWPYMLYDIQQRALLLTSLGYLFFCVVVVITLQYVHPLPVAAGINIEVVRVSVTILTILFLLLLTWYFCSSNAAAEEVLLQEKVKAETASRAKSSFLANMSHELRTPMNAILGFSELLLRDSSITEQQRANLETIGRTGTHLLSLINDVLEFSKIEAGRIELHPDNFHLEHLLCELQEMFQLHVEHKGLSLKFSYDEDVPRYIYADLGKLRQILINILGNAVKFTDRGGVTLTLKMKQLEIENQQKKNYLSFVISDTGIGISEEEQKNIFDVFFQSETNQAATQGTGLGLPISKKIAKLMGGALVVESGTGKGTTFTLDIPLIQGERTTEKKFGRKQPIHLAANTQTYRLLVADDNESNRSLLATLLRNAGFEVREAVNGQEAIDCWREWQPHLIWMDIRMPEVDGYEAIATIKSELHQKCIHPVTKIIALTASAFEEDRKKILQHGGDGFIRKPYNTDDIFSMISEHLDVEFIHDEREMRPRMNGEKLHPRNELTTSINNLSADLRVRLMEATELSDASMIDQVIDAIRSCDSTLAEALAELAEEFAYDKILSLVHNANNINGENKLPT